MAHYHRIETADMDNAGYHLKRLNQLLIRIESECNMSDVDEKLRVNIAQAREHLSKIEHYIAT